MKDKKVDALEVCKEFEDVLAPRLKLSVLDRAVYWHLLRHSRFEGRLRFRFSIIWLANNMGVTARRVRQAVRRLVDLRALRLIERSNFGHVVEVRLPQEVCAARANLTGTDPQAKAPGGHNLDELDFWRTRSLRQSIHARERGLCFYCLRQTPGPHCLDHVVPLAKSGSNSYRNLVSSCMECNSRKRDLPAADFLRILFREGRLSAKDLSTRLSAVQALAAGKLRPQVFNPNDAASGKSKEAPRHPEPACRGAL